MNFAVLLLLLFMASGGVGATNPVDEWIEFASLHPWRLAGIVGLAVLSVRGTIKMFPTPKEDRTEKFVKMLFRIGDEQRRKEEPNGKHDH